MQTAPRSPRRVLFLGGCQAASLREELAGDFDCFQHWRAPTIALMSDPTIPATALDFDDRHARYILEDCAKTHLKRLRAADFDALVFEVVRDVRTPLVQRGKTFLFDPNQMHFRVPDAPPQSARSIDLGAFLGTADIVPFDADDPSFFEVWSEHFHSFYDAVLGPRIAKGCAVVVQELLLAKQTIPPSDALRHRWDYCDRVNALLRDMYRRVASYPGVKRIGLDEALYVSSKDAPYGGPTPIHPTREVYAALAKQTREIIASETRRVARAI